MSETFNLICGDTDELSLIKKMEIQHNSPVIKQNKELAKIAATELVNQSRQHLVCSRIHGTKSSYLASKTSDGRSYVDMHYCANKISRCGEMMKKSSLSMVHVYNKDERIKRDSNHLCHRLKICVENNTILLSGLSKDVENIDELWLMRDELHDQEITFRGISRAIKQQIKNGIKNTIDKNASFLASA